MTNDIVDEVIENGRNILVDKWMSESEFKDLVENNDNLKECIDLCTSPAKEDIFNAFRMFPIEKTRVLILGQDPYAPKDNKQKATGYAFLQKPKDNYDDSLKNILVAIKQCPKINSNKNTENYEKWVKNNHILLLNSALTYGDKTKTDKLTKKEKEEIQNKHLNAWKNFINLIIKKLLVRENKKLVIFLWGEKAKISFHNAIYNDKDEINIINDIKGNNMLVLSTSHPSNNGNAVKKGFCYEIKNHLEVCNLFLDKSVNWQELLDIYKQ